MAGKVSTIGCLLLSVVLPLLPADALSEEERTGVVKLESVSVTPLTAGVKITVTANATVDTYHSFTLDSPARIVFDFPRMKSPFVGGQAIAADSEWAIRVRHFAHPDKVRLVIDTKKAYLSAYTALPFSSGLDIYVGAETQAEARQRIAADIPPSGATRLESLSFDPGDDSTRIVIKADGEIRDYESFPLDNPARIVFDLFQLKSPHRGLETLSSDSKQVKAVRYYGHPDKVRLVLDTAPPYLSTYTAEPRADGLVIVVGRPESLPILKAGEADAAPMVSVQSREDPPVLREEEMAAIPSDPEHGRSDAQLLQAAKITGQAPHVDGNLDEAIWRSAPAATGFVQYQPDEGAPASERSEVRVLYGEKALYVGFRAFEQDPSAIDAQLTRRDQRSFSDWVSLAIDSYNDRRTAFQFSVNPKGVKRDAYLHDDTRWDGDWDAVWDVEAVVDNQGWTAEFRIPYSQLRFPRRADQTWGIQFGRTIARREETSYWAPMSIREYAVVSKFGRLSGMNGVEPARRLEIMPYTMGKVQRAPGDVENPMYEENDWSAKLGMDVKYGVTGNLTLDVTVNPDFGQVEADPARVNLTAFETFFSERRPFFIEGANIFDFVLGFGPTGMPDEKLFYSRRIGRRPHGAADPQGGYVEAPDATTIQIAEKLSGKTASGWTIGLLHAATAEEEAHIITQDGLDTNEVVEPPTQYGMVRLERDFRKGYSALGVVATGVFRESDEADALTLHRRAFAGGIDFRHRFWSDKYEISGYVLGSQVLGSEEAIAASQQASSRYMHRPDADHVTYDPERTSLEGTSASLSFRKVGQGSWRYGAVVRGRSPEFEVNDMGFARQSDMLMTSTYLAYYHYLPTRHLRRWSLSWNNWYMQTHGGERTGLGTSTYLRLELPSHWSVRAGVNYSFGSLSTNTLRGGPAFQTDDRFSVFTRIGTDSRKRMQLNLSTSYSSHRESDSWSYRVSPSLDWRPAGRVQMSVGASYTRDESDSQWVDRWWKEYWEVTDERPYIFGHMSQETIYMTGRVEVAFTPNLSFQLYAQPFVSAGRFDEFKQVVDPRAERYGDRLVLLRPEIDADCFGAYSTDVVGNRNELCMAKPDFNYKQFRSNAVLRWEYRPGSALFVVWSQGRHHSDEMGNLDFGSDFGTLFDAPADDVFLVKVKHWF